MVPKEIQNLAATWKQTGQENIDKQLEAAGLGWAKRKIAVNLSTTVTFSFPDDDTFYVDFVTKVMSKKEKFSISKVTKHKNFLDEDVESELFVEDGHLVMVTKGGSPGEIRTVRIVEGDKLTIKTTVVKKNVTGIRTFERQK
ncbi:unnamed protein product [Oikopleura dioica]|uniref:Lipocalin/cytosolic fatty-acid binding domain-containing protein n=1 Tax=Oikopleura dioica TaxID=34765 RepID=E4Y9A3_OIKDI|nr:unnamed protein product [Oikopleura dioica]